MLSCLGDLVMHPLHQLCFPLSLFFQNKHRSVGLVVSVDIHHLGNDHVLGDWGAQPCHCYWTKVSGSNKTSAWSQQYLYMCPVGFTYSVLFPRKQTPLTISLCYCVHIIYYAVFFNAWLKDNAKFCVYNTILVHYGRR